MADWAQAGGRGGRGGRGREGGGARGGGRGGGRPHILSEVHAQPAANSAVSALDPQRIPLTSDVDVNESRVCHRLHHNDSIARPSTLLIWSAAVTCEAQRIANLKASQTHKTLMKSRTISLMQEQGGNVLGLSILTVLVQQIECC